MIKALTGAIFVPMIVQNSPIGRKNDVMILLRNIEWIDKLKLDTDSILDDKRLGK